MVSFASAIGATLAMLAARYLFRDTIQQRFGKRLDEVNKGVAGKGVSVYSVVCRDPGKRGTKLMADWGASLPLLMEGDQTAKDYQVQGYPSFVVIDGEGKIAAFFQGATSKEDLMKAMAGATGGK